jgi:hypothetical protein
MPVLAEIVAEDGAGWLRLDGRLSAGETGRLVELWLGEAAAPRESVERILQDSERSVFGGVRLTDPATGAQVLPGCCLLLEDWRTWVDAKPDLGHDGPWPEVDDAGLTIWPRGDEDWRAEAVREGQPVRVVRSEMPRICRMVQADLEGLLEALARWAGNHCPELADELVAHADRTFAVTAPLDGLE